MDRNRRTLVWIWLATTAVVAGVALLLYRSATRTPDLAGRTDPAVIWEDPTALFTDPGILGTAVEMQVTEAVRSCMAERGQDFRGPAVAEDIYAILDPSRDGYGIAAGGDTPRPTLGSGGPSVDERPAYEIALYGAPLDAEGGGDGGCAAIGYQTLAAAVDGLENLPYPIDQLEADALSDPVYVAALDAWAACMAERGYTAASPDDLLERQRASLAAVGGDAARSLGVEELRIAADDFACRNRTLDPATRTVAERLAPEFVARNRAQLETLIPQAGRPELPSGLGSGDVQVTLIWSSKADLDLMVTDPALDEVFYNNRTVASGGTLDRDANFPCNSDSSSPAAENIFWPTGQAPEGSYTATVVFTSDCLGEGSQTFDLIVQVGGTVVHQQRHTLATQGERFSFDFTVGSR
ncbi:MAG: hypothetical protein A2Z12_05205 [Actinobacteria bacterium RBG_16_68_21]|nr:MAG: hypothetical protein A2Z12_05205 [Actinobacteria bacterium RBG_16_68_21]